MSDGGSGTTPIKINIDMGEVTQQLEDLTTQLGQLLRTMQTFGQQQYQIGQGVSNVFNQTQTSAVGATDAVKSFFASLTGSRPGGTALGGILNYGLESGIVQDIASFPLRYMQSQISANRQTALNVQGGLAGQAFATGVRLEGGFGGTSPFGGPSAGNIFTALKNFTGNTPGLPTGTPDEIIQLLNIARQAGGMIDLNNLAGGGGLRNAANQRGEGFMRSVYQAQQMYPGTPLPALAGSIGGFVANTQAQQQSAYLTGGAFSMVKSGGRQKSLDEWAESVLRWLENQRPGPDRGKPFTHGQLLTQQFPGSNIDAWLSMNGVPPDMKEMWWTYALGKTAGGGTTEAANKFNFETDIPASSTAMQRLRTTGTLSATAFRMAEGMSGQYYEREQMNQGFARGVQGPLVSTIQSAFGTGGPLNFLSRMPDVMEEFLMTLMERLGPLGSVLSGIVGWGGIGGAVGANAAAGAAVSGAGGVRALFENLLGPEGLIFGGMDLPASLQDFDFSLWPPTSLGRSSARYFPVTPTTATSVMLLISAGDSSAVRHRRASTPT